MISSIATRQGLGGGAAGAMECAIPLLDGRDLEEADKHMYCTYIPYVRRYAGFRRSRSRPGSGPISGQVTFLTRFLPHSIPRRIVFYGLDLEAALFAKP